MRSRTRRDEAERWEGVYCQYRGSLQLKRGRCDMYLSLLSQTALKSITGIWKVKSTRPYTCVCRYTYTPTSTHGKENKNRCVMSTNFGIWKDNLCMLTHPAEERRLRPKCLWRDTISSVLINSGPLKREKHCHIAFANLHDIMTPTVTNFKLSTSCYWMWNWKEMCKTASRIWLQHATGYTKVDWFISPVPKGGAYGNTVPWKIKMRLGTESRIGSPVYGVVRSPALPTQPSLMPAPSTLQEISLVFGESESERFWI